MNRMTFFKNLRHWYRRMFWYGEVMQDNAGAGGGVGTGADAAQEQVLSRAAQRVLADLRGFCRADTSCVVFGKDGRVDTHATAVLEGRREVWLKIVQTLNISDAQLVRLMNAGTGNDDQRWSDEHGYSE